MKERLRRQSRWDDYARGTSPKDDEMSSAQFFVTVMLAALAATALGWIFTQL